MFKKIIKISTLFLVLGIILGGCSFSFPWEEDRSPVIEFETGSELENNEESDLSSDQIEEKNVKGELRKFSSLSALNDYFSKFQLPALDLEKWYDEDSYGPGSLVATKNLTDSSVKLDTPGVFKMSNGYAYSLERNNIKILKISPLNSSSVISTIALEETPLELAISDSHMAVSGAYTQTTGEKFSFLKIYDISSPENIKEIKSYDFSGSYIGLRLINSYAYFLTISSLDNGKGRLLPTVKNNQGNLGSDCSTNNDCLKSQAYYFNHSYNNYGWLSVASINLDEADKKIVRQVYLLDDSYRLYISEENNIYLSHEESQTFSDVELEVKKDILLDNFSEEDRAVIESLANAPLWQIDKKIKEEVKVYIDHHISNLSEDEKDALDEEIEEALKLKVKKISKDLDVIDIYKFSLKSDGLKYDAKNSVGGQFLATNSFDEKDGYLRVVTKRGELWPLLFSGEKKEYSNVYVLDESLTQLGSLENIASKDDLNEVMFIGERVYLFSSGSDGIVYVVDLSFNDNLAILGALQVGSYKNFYPADVEGKKIIALGRHEAEITSDEENGLKLSIFDFSDLQKPSELSSYVIGDEYSDSIALSDELALTNILDRKLIALPASFQDGGALSFSGLLVFTYNDEGKLTLDHRFDHSAGGHFETSDTWRNFSYSDNTVRRSFIEGSSLFSFSNKYLKVNNLSDGGELASINLTPGPDDERINELLNQINQAQSENRENDFLPEDGIVDNLLPEDGLNDGMESPYGDFPEGEFNEDTQGLLNEEDYLLEEVFFPEEGYMSEEEYYFEDDNEGEIEI